MHAKKSVPSKLEKDHRYHQASPLSPRKLLKSQQENAKGNRIDSPGLL